VRSPQPVLPDRVLAIGESPETDAIGARNDELHDLFTVAHGIGAALPESDTTTPGVTSEA